MFINKKHKHEKAQKKKKRSRISGGPSESELYSCSNMVQRLMRRGLSGIKLCIAAALNYGEKESHNAYVQFS